ncbi:MAG TPA: trp RNA-binding attenuation protein MtrB [Candidatus Aphodoplasma excrementigallinarum]|uniref:Transcription attenuation protein MtrB n=1 Tax=Candidatus Aphodoplasma excrementigallinarum TaxID=2840673 RepID=A0A9D1NH05_9FIRM|nr:trp RNA-binding attenuation protein MtrB [Candidatus Aphodoplasma excrementigallinarum]
MEEAVNSTQDYVVIQAEENGVTIWGLTRGSATKFHHTEKLDAGEVYIAQFTEVTSAMKIHGKAKVYTKHGVIEAGK